MLDRLRQMAIFAKTVDHGSFRAAAEALRLSPSVVSHHISELEEELGTALLYRSTRKLSLTSDGEALLSSARTMLEAAEAGLSALGSTGDQLSGELRVTLPAVLAQSHVVDRIAAFSLNHPNVRLSLDFSDLRREMVADGYDLAIRMGWLKDSALKARKLYDVERVLVAAQCYVQERELPQKPDDLGDWNWVQLTQTPIKLALSKEGEGTVRLKPSYAISVNDAHALSRLAHAGAGLAILPDFLAERGLAEGTLTALLPDWQVEELGVYAVWPPNAPKGGLTARLVESLVGVRVATSQASF